MCVSTCQGLPDIWKTSTDTSPMRATPNTSRVDGPLPESCQDAVAEMAIAAISTAGISQSRPRIIPIATASGTCSQSSANSSLLVISRKFDRSSVSMVIPGPQMAYLEMQAAIACGSMASQTPALRSRASPSCRSGRTTRSDGTAVILTIAASAEAAASNACSALHHGGKATATISDPGRTCNDSAATATKLASSNAAALSQTGHREVEVVVSRSIARNNTGVEL